MLRSRNLNRLPHTALLLLSLALAAAVAWLTWPTRTSVLCEQLPELTALAVCAATLFVFSIRAVSTANRAEQDRRIAGAAAVLAALAFFLSVHFVAQYHRPCVEVQRQVRPAH